MELKLHVHGRGNAWPVPLGETHPFYNRNDCRDLSNAAYSLTASEQGSMRADVLIDAGHGTIQSLISGRNRIPDCICLTHGHMDHTLSVDWVVQSFWRHHEKKRLYPVYATASVYRFMLKSYPHLEKLIEFRELIPGVTRPLEGSNPFNLTAYPVYHGQGAAGSSMLLFETVGKKLLFTGDLLSPLLRNGDYERLMNADLVVADANNRYPWPRTNHWSFAGGPESPMERDSTLRSFIETLSWEDLTAPHELPLQEESFINYFSQLKKEWDLSTQPFTVMEFLRKIDPKLLVPVHYSGAEDSRYHREKILDGAGLRSWIEHTMKSEGLLSEILLPLPGQVIPL